MCPTGDAPCTTCGATAPRGRRLNGGTPSAKRWAPTPGCASLARRLSPDRSNCRARPSPYWRHALFRTGKRRPRGVPHRQGALRHDRCTCTAGASSHGRRALRHDRGTWTAGRRPTGNAPSPRNGAPAPGVVRICFLGRNRIRIHADPSYLITDNSLS